MRKFFLLSLFIVLADQISKYYLQGKNIELFSFLSFNYIENTGAAFGILQDQKLLLIIISFIVLILVIYYWRKISEQEQLALSFILAGTFGNLFDRIFRGFVIDFIDFGFWPAFNIADISNVIGALLLVYLFIFQTLNKTPIR